MQHNQSTVKLEHCISILSSLYHFLSRAHHGTRVSAVTMNKCCFIGYIVNTMTFSIPGSEVFFSKTSQSAADPVLFGRARKSSGSALLPKKLSGGVRHTWEILTLFHNKICDFHYPFSDPTQNWIPCLTPGS